MTLHRDLAAGRWTELGLHAQLGNVGAEVGRAIAARTAGNAARAEGALTRALELFDLTLADARHSPARRREIARAREVTCDFLVGDNEYGSTSASLEAWFMAYAMAARRIR
jgi:hypothetical protein